MRHVILSCINAEHARVWRKPALTLIPHDPISYFVSAVLKILVTLENTWMAFAIFITWSHEINLKYEQLTK